MSTIIFSFLECVRILEYIDVLHSRHHKVDTVPKIFVFGKRGLISCISLFFYPIKPIAEKYPNHPKSHKFYNLVLIAEDLKRIHKNSSVSNVYTFSHVDVKGV